MSHPHFKRSLTRQGTKEFGGTTQRQDFQIAPGTHFTKLKTAEELALMLQDIALAGDNANSETRKAT